MATVDLTTRAGISDYLQSFDLFRGNDYEGKAYVEDALSRFLITTKMVPPAQSQDAKLLELGANPYFITLLLKKIHGYQIEMANYFGSGNADGEQTIHSERYDETHTFRYAHFNVEFDDFPYPDDSFDGVLFCEIIEHLTQNPTHTLNEIHRVLKPGGFVIVTTPNMLRWEHVVNLARGRNINDPYSGYGVYGRHNREYAPRELIRLLEETGFRVETVRLANTHPGSLVQTIASNVRTHWKEHMFAMARAEGQRRSYYGPWLYRSMVGMRRITSSTVTMGTNDELHTSLGWHLDAPDSPIRWTQKRAEITLRANGGEEAIMVDMNTGSTMFGPVRVTLQSGENTREFEPPMEQWQPVVLPISPAEPGQHISLEIEVDHLRCPADVGYNLDGRQLGVMVRYVALLPAE